MKFKVWIVAILAVALSACTNVEVQPSQPDTIRYPVVIDPATTEKVTQIIHSTVLPNKSLTHGAMIASVSEAFLGTPYQAHTMVGSSDKSEALVVNFNGVDCFTLIDYVEALTRSDDEKSFLNNLVQVRYIDGKVGYLSRRHFFTDWTANTPQNAIDITMSLSTATRSTTKQLNRKENCDCEEYIEGLGFITRVVNYIPSSEIDATVLSKLQTGDYIGIYSPLIGLDVSHVGIAIRKDGQVWFRNASSLAANMKVVDTPLHEYMHNKPGMVVLRAVNSMQPNIK